MVASIPRVQSALIFLMDKILTRWGIFPLNIDTLSKDLFLYLCCVFALRYVQRHEGVVFSARASVAVFLLRTNKTSIFSLWFVCFIVCCVLQIQGIMNFRRTGRHEDN